MSAYDFDSIVTPRIAVPRPNTRHKDPSKVTEDLLDAFSSEDEEDRKLAENVYRTLGPEAKCRGLIRVLSSPPSDRSDADSRRFSLAAVLLRKEISRLVGAAAEYRASGADRAASAEREVVAHVLWEMVNPLPERYADNPYEGGRRSLAECLGEMCVTASRLGDDALREYALSNVLAAALPLCERGDAPTLTLLGDVAERAPLAFWRCVTQTDEEARLARALTTAVANGTDDSRPALVGTVFRVGTASVLAERAARLGYENYAADNDGVMADIGPSSLERESVRPDSFSSKLGQSCLQPIVEHLSNHIDVDGDGDPDEKPGADELQSTQKRSTLSKLMGGPSLVELQALANQNKRKSPEWYKGVVGLAVRRFRTHVVEGAARAPSLLVGYPETLRTVVRFCLLLAKCQSNDDIKFSGLDALAALCESVSIMNNSDLARMLYNNDRNANVLDICMTTIVEGVADDMEEWSRRPLSLNVAEGSALDEEVTSSAGRAEALLQRFLRSLGGLPLLLRRMQTLFDPEKSWRHHRAGLAAMEHGCLAAPRSFAPYAPTALKRARELVEAETPRLRWQALRLVRTLCDVVDNSLAVSASHKLSPSRLLECVRVGLEDEPVDRVADQACACLFALCRRFGGDALAPRLPELVPALVRARGPLAGGPEWRRRPALTARAARAVAAVAARVGEEIFRYYGDLMNPLVTAATVERDLDTPEDVRRASDVAVEAACVVAQAACRNRDNGAEVFQWDARKLMDRITSLLEDHYGLVTRDDDGDDVDGDVDGDVDLLGLDADVVEPVVDPAGQIHGDPTFWSLLSSCARVATVLGADFEPWLETTSPFLRRAADELRFELDRDNVRDHVRFREDAAAAPIRTLDDDVAILSDHAEQQRRLAAVVDDLATALGDVFWSRLRGAAPRSPPREEEKKEAEFVGGEGDENVPEGITLSIDASKQGNEDESSCGLSMGLSFVDTHGEEKDVDTLGSDEDPAVESEDQRRLRNELYMHNLLVSTPEDALRFSAITKFSKSGNNADDKGVMERRFKNECYVRNILYYGKLEKQETDEFVMRMGNGGRIDFLEDEPSSMTFGRVIALKLIDKKWYNPQAGAKDDGAKQFRDNLIAILSKDGLSYPDYLAALANAKAREPLPCLHTSWTFFEHVSLPRFLYKAPKDPREESFCKKLISCVRGRAEFERAGPGENRRSTKLYSPLFTPLKQMGDFGLGVGLYFSTLFSIALVCFIAGLINITNIQYFRSYAYSKGQANIQTLAQGSAICTVQKWVPCPGCTHEQYIDELDRYQNITVNGTELHFAVKNDCMPRFQDCMVNLGTLFFLIIAFIFLNRYSSKMEEQFDEDEQTAQDYSIHVKNPPGDAYDAEEWKAFFSQFGHVTVCTLAIDNDLLCKTLVQRREICQRIFDLLPAGTDMSENNLTMIAAEAEASRSKFKSFMFCILPISDVATLVGKFIVLSSKVRGLAQVDNHVTNVFITFETEDAQRKALNALSFPGRIKWFNKTSKVPSEHLFRGDLVLDVDEAEEPSSIRWQDINGDFLQATSMMIFTSIMCVILIAISYTITAYIWTNISVTTAALSITYANLGFTTLAKMLTDMEIHGSETNKQASLYMKICCFRWFNTAIIMQLLTPFTSTITPGEGHLIYSLAKIFMSEMCTTSIMQILDIGGNVKRHVLAPRAKTQRASDKMFEGTETQLAERYTNMTKIMFLSFFYSAIYPAAFFLCATALIVNFWVDGFSVMRTWKPFPSLGKTISQINRKYFLTLTLVAYGAASSSFWSGWPFDNLCKINDEVNGFVGANDPYIGTFELSSQFHPGGTVKTSFTEGHAKYKFCNQYMASYKSGGFPPFSSNEPEDGRWMNDDQRLWTDIYSWVSLVTVLMVIIQLVYTFVIGTIVPFFVSPYSAVGDDMGVGFSAVDAIDAYIPQIHSNQFSYPLLACDENDFDQSLITWTDHVRGYSFYSLLYDVEDILEKKLHDNPEIKVFHKVCHWPPPDALAKEIT